MNILHNNSRSGKHVPGLGPGLVPGLGPSPRPLATSFIILESIFFWKRISLIFPILRHNTKNTTEKYIFVTVKTNIKY